MFGGNDGDLKCVAKVLAAKFVIKVRAVLGPEDEDQKDEVLLGRFVRWRSWRIEWKADVAGEDQDTDVFIDEAKEFRAAVARLNYLVQDSPDVQCPAKVLSSEMVDPTTASWRRLKKVVRFLVESELCGDSLGSPWRRRPS